MQDDKPERVISMLDDEWEETMHALSDDEKVAYARKVYDVMSQNLEAYPGVTPEMLETLKAQNEDFKREVDKSKIADQNAAIAKVKLHRSADSYLAALDEVDKSRGQ